MRIEIGSEFEESENKLLKESTFDYWVKGNDYKLTFSGRTSLDLILHDIGCYSTVYLPDYCCESMITPFIDHGFDCKFYEVKFEENNVKLSIDSNIQNSVILFMGYFGFSKLNDVNTTSKIQDQGNIIIYDATHSFFSQTQGVSADYTLASLRKWLPIPSGGIAIKTKGLFKEDYTLNNSNEIVQTKIEAMRKKKDYLEGRNIEKGFLQDFKMFNEQLKNSYKNLDIDHHSEMILRSYDYKKMIDQRRINAEQLLYELDHKEVNVKVLTDSIGGNDVPLFLPIEVPNRESLRTYLIKEGIYLPVHWPTPNHPYFENVKKKIYRNELSIVCDQRYSCDDMRFLVQKVREYYKNGHIF
ncbi:hypothetical protein [Salinicoccus roseus]|uniref:hypothetical protein n=1 Tax=Salinicoccus roseus TaxID=45670 RepID=UPI001EF58F7F|nr:hypothetical protein [Salinicoccus roseus]MCG7333055.1 hypothetical protein [Salinicoccus roseus]